MTAADTSREAVEGLIAALESPFNACCNRGDCTATLRALLAENETLRAERGEAVEALGPFAVAAGRGFNEQVVLVGSRCAKARFAAKLFVTNIIDASATYDKLAKKGLAATVYSKLRGQHES